MTLLDDHPVTSESPVTRPEQGRREISAWRFAARLARRETRRRPGRTTLAALLIAVPVMAMTLGSVLARSGSGEWSSQFERRFGAADIATDPQFAFSSDSTGAGAVLPEGTVVDEYLWVYSSITTSMTADVNRYVFGAITDVPVSGSGESGPIRLTEGRAPDIGEMLLNPELAGVLGVSIGDQVTFERPAGTWTLSGLGRMRDSYYNDVIVIPGFDRDRVAPGQSQSITFYDLPDGVSPETTRQLAAELGGVTRFDDPYGEFGTGIGRGMAWGWVAGALTLVAVGIIVAAAFATSARRQLVTIGQLLANGATPRVVRRTLALQGTWTGLAGSVVGIGAGLAVLPFVRSLVEVHILRHDIASYRFNLVDLLVIAGTATIAGTVAAAVPARSASKTPVMAALAGRRPLGRLPRWLVPTGLLLLAGGVGLVAIASLGINGSSSSNANDVWALLIVLGVVGIVFGMCCATPLVVERVGRLGRRLSLSWRLALRSLARSRTRSSAVIAAIAVAVGGSIAAGAIVEASIRDNQASWIPTVPADTIVLDVYHYQDFGQEPIPRVVDLPPLTDAAMPVGLREGILAVVPDATFVPLRMATVDPPPADTVDGDFWPEPSGPRIADPALLDILGLSDADIAILERAGTLQPAGQWELSGNSQYSPATYTYVGEDGPIDLDAPLGTTMYDYLYAGNAPLITEEHARELGFDIVQRGQIVRSSRPLTDQQRQSLQAVAIAFQGQPTDSFIEPGDPPRVAGTAAELGGDQWSVVYDEPSFRQSNDDLWIARLVIGIAAVLISLLVVSIGLSLAAAEGRDERNVLAVVGATPASMRRQAAARAAVLALAGIGLGVPTGFVPAWVLYEIVSSDQSTTESLRFPWLIVAGLVVVVPALVAAVAWAGSGVGQRFRPASPTQRD